MRKTLIALTVALASASMAITPAQAKGKGFGIGLGVGLLVGGALLHRHHHHHPRTVIIPSRPVVVQPTAQQPAALPAVRLVDDLGRTYDVASHTWFDGRDRCFKGAQAWTFRGGSWFYGSATWYENAGQWMTNAPTPPAQVDCASVPVFAARLPSVGPVTPASTESAGAPVAPETAERMRAGLSEGIPTAAN